MKKKRKIYEFVTSRLVPNSFVSFPFSSLKSGKNWDVGGSLLNNLLSLYDDFFKLLFSSLSFYKNFLVIILNKSSISIIIFFFNIQIINKNRFLRNNLS